MNPLLVVGHGTKSEAGVTQFTELVEQIRRNRPDRAVEGGFLELSAPPIQEAVTRLAAAATVVDVVPLVLVAAGHSKGDIPAALEREKRRHSGLTFRYGRPLGAHPLLLAEAEARIEAVLPRAAWSDTAVVLVGRGASDPDANAEIAKTARLLQEGRRLPAVETSFISLAEPGVPAALDRVRLLGFGRVVVLPWLLFHGVLPDRIVEQSHRWAAKHSGVEVLSADVLGPCPGLVEVVLERWREVASGDLRMNCDSCMYRVALPGFETRLGAPQVPHDHPDDPADSHRHMHVHG